MSDQPLFCFLVQVMLITLKRKIPTDTLKRLDAGDFVVPETRSFPIVKAADVKAAVSAWGRGTAARAAGVTFEKFKARLIRLARRKGPAFVAALPAEWGAQKKERAQKDHSYASTQFNMPVGVMAKALTFAVGIDEADLAAGGVETQCHVTIKYGLRDDALPQIVDIAQDYAPIRLKFGAVTLFEREEFDVVKVDVESEELRRLHSQLAALLPNNEDWPQYDPHLTIAYVKPGLGQKYAGDGRGDGPLMGESAVVDTICFTTSDDRKVDISLREMAVSPAYKENSLRANTHFATYKDKDGRWRWLMISSNSYQDRDGHWVTQKAQEADVNRMNESGDFGTLDWWHTKLKIPAYAGKDGRIAALELGDCDHAVMLGRFRLESGTYRDEATGAAFAATDKTLKGSLEYFHPKSEPVGGEFHHIYTIRRSVLPSGRPANLLTGFATSQKELEMNTFDRLKAMAGTAGVDATLKAIAEALELEGAAKGLGLTAKGDVSLQKADLESLEAQIAAEKERRAKTPAESETTAEVDGAELASMIGTAVKEAVDGLGDRLEAVLTKRTKEQVETDRQAAALETKIKELQAQYEDLVNPSRAINRAKEQPGGYRPTQQNPATTQKGAAETNGSGDFSAIQETVGFLSGKADT
jgi:hypothetical protein